ncbi:Na/Pi cotransporter family protein [Thauera linaloolentis]|uniref:Na/Pi-cotransporter II-like protein n=1 Tax=Thauera linaloolentis (strain DSM 12138 / JCM 21573 / CCUG 41526 / CIP 105981 / IAM 15112 / NBRC 102519 / 47Lol) TaxID=1123367 RepID=N6XXA2_THAL4|nr:Na/Pi-cotransporter II-like protein [Thauera linaloolentis 47Lol = DSM 12138]MCM8564220.1 Na/Pi symporter [Thauera linaloolentis]
MNMMTDGLKLAAGRALEGLLERGTATAPRGLAAGYLITALVQSSTAVTVASIGFVNTGLLSLKNALWVIFGSNLGSTMNAWLVAVLGFGFRIDAFALPFVGIGAILMLAGRTLRARSLGQALAGFGVLFLGIGVLKDSFSGIGDMVDLQDFIAPGLAGWLILVGIGTLLTVIMQTSGAVIAIVITAAQGGLLSVEAACAIVIGTNIGTTSTAILAAIGATSNARRLAAAHVMFNVVTGIVALLLLPLLIGLVDWLRGVLEQPATPALMIALFHTTFNALGVLLMVPLAPGMLRMLNDMFRTREEEVARPQHLDTNSLAIPDLAMHALRLELTRTQGFAVAALAAATQQPPDEPVITRETAALQALAPAIGNYAHQLSAAALPPTLVEQLAHSLRTLRYQETAAVLLHEASSLLRSLSHTETQGFASKVECFRQAVAHLAEAADPRHGDFSPGAVSVRLDEAEACYQALKEALFLAGAHARLDIRSMQEWLRLASVARRAAKQVAKAARMIAALEEGTSATEAAQNEESDENAD